MADEKPPEGAAASDEAKYQKELAEMVKGAADELKPKPDGEPKEPEGSLAESLGDAGDEPEADGDDDDDEKDEDEKPEDKGKYSKAFRKLQKEEADLQAFKTSVIEEKKEVHRLRAEVDTREREIVAFVKALRLDPFETLLQHKIITPEQAEYISKQLYYKSPAAQADPKNRAEAERLRAQEAVRLEAEETRRRLQAMESERAEERQKAQQQQELNAYSTKFTTVLDSYKSKTPLLAKALEKHPEATMRELYSIANDLSAAKKAYADPALVILAWTKERKRVLAAHGISEPAAAPAASKKSNPPPAAKKEGPPNDAKNSSTAAPEKLDEDAYWKELNRRLKGE